MPLISIIIPLYNAEAFILKTLDSILQESVMALSSNLNAWRSLIALTVKSVSLKSM